MTERNRFMDEKDILEYVRRCSRNITEYRDKETGVHYLIFAESNGSGGGYGGLCPRYNADGSLYVD